MSFPPIIQGGMGVAVSGWRLARAVAQLNQLGIVSGALIAVVFARRLQAGDADGQMRHAMNHFPIRDIAERVLERHYVPGGKAPSEAFSPTIMPTLTPGSDFVELTVAANFAEVFLAKEGHTGTVGINLLEKSQLITLPSLYGAMLANVDYVLMGAGIPRSIPGVLDHFAHGEAAELRVDVEGAAIGETFSTRFDPQRLGNSRPQTLQRPKFLAIVSSATLATTLARKSNGRVDGFVIEGSTAGGHNAPPRGPLQLSSRGEPIYGPRDIPDLGKFRELGLPFWLAGAYGHPEKLAEAQNQGAIGVQVGTAFAFCEESGLDIAIKRRVCQSRGTDTARAFTDPLASPTGFPFKVMQLEKTLSDATAYANRERICDLGYLRQAYRRPDGTLGYRCAAEPEPDFARKGGEASATAGRKCLCNALLANVGLGQVRAGGLSDDKLLTVGDDIVNLKDYLRPGCDSYTAADVIGYLLGKNAPA